MLKRGGQPIRPRGGDRKKKKKKKLGVKQSRGD